MSCSSVPIPGGHAIVCTRGPTRSAKCACGAKATIACDHPGVEDGTCDAPLCRRCAVKVGPNIDHCPEHGTASAPTPSQSLSKPGPVVRGPLQALTLWQPWASAILVGAKPWENRSWAPAALKATPPRPMWVALHAGATTDTSLSRPERGYRFGRGWQMLRELWPELPGGRDYTWPRGLLGLVRFDYAESFEPGAVCHDDPWCSGPLCWRVGRVVALPQPIACQGAQRLWRVPEEHLEAFRDLLRANRG